MRKSTTILARLEPAQSAKLNAARAQRAMSTSEIIRELIDQLPQPAYCVGSTNAKVDVSVRQDLHADFAVQNY